MTPLDMVAFGVVVLVALLIGIIKLQADQIRALRDRMENVR